MAERLPPRIPKERPNVTYQVAKEDDLLETQTWKRWSVRVLKNGVSLIIFPIGIFRVCATYFGFVTASLHSKDKVERYQQLSQKELPDGNYTLDRLSIKTADGVVLDTITLENEAQDPEKPQKWIVYFNGNGACWEKTLPDQIRLSLATGAHVYTGNYRGVGKSKGFALSSNDLLCDGETMVQYLLQKRKVKPENILLYGWSMGALIATDLAAMHPEMAHCNDRSFASTYLQVKSIVQGVFGSLIGKLAARITCAAGWTFNTAESYLKAGERKFIIFCHKDSIIPYEASVYLAVKSKRMTPEERRAKRERRRLKKRGAQIPLYSQRYKPERIRLKRRNVTVKQIPRPAIKGNLSFFNFLSWVFLKIRSWYVGQDIVGYHTHIAPLTGNRKYTWEKEIFDAFCSRVRTMLDLNPFGEES